MFRSKALGPPNRRLGETETSKKRRTTVFSLIPNLLATKLRQPWRPHEHLGIRGPNSCSKSLADRYERSSRLTTSNLPLGEWQQISQGERMPASLRDRLTHHCEIFEMTGDSFRFRESLKNQQGSTRSSTKRAADKKKQDRPVGRS